MPPSPKFTRQQIVEAALGLINEKGIEALTARELASALGSSSRPIFTVFRDMDDLRGAVREAAENRFAKRLQDAMHYTPAFKMVGMQSILFAMEEPELFKLLNMTGGSRAIDFDELFERNAGRKGGFMGFITEQYGLNEREAKALFKHVWVYTYGIGVLCATGMCSFTREQLVQMLGSDFQGMLMYIKSGGINRVTDTPVPNDREEVGG